MRLSIFISLFLIGCANSKNNCGNKVLVLWPTSAGLYQLQEIGLTTLSSPYELSGAAAKVYFENGINPQGFIGPVAQPRYTSSGDICVPLDAESSLAVSVYAQFERIYQFELKLGTADLLSWPRHVGVNIHVAAEEGIAHNNAHYFSEGDAIAILPYSLGGVPLSLNHGVVAHEHFHAHFQRQVMDAMNSHLSGDDPRPAEEIQDVDMSRPRSLNNFVLRAWNEGLADLYGAVFADDPNFFTASLPALAGARNLSLPVQPFGTAAELRSYAARLENKAGIITFSYLQGALLARLLHRIAHSGIESPADFVARILRALKNIPDEILPTYDVRVLDIEVILPVLLEGLALTSQACELLEQGLSKDLMVRSFSQCRAP